MTKADERKDIVDYINSVVYSHAETMMKRWREEDKKMAIESLSEKAALAAYGGHIDVARVLVKHNANVNFVDSGGWTLLYDAIWGHWETGSQGDHCHLAQLLLEHGANANARATNGWTPSHRASMDPSKLGFVRMLLEHGADLVDAEYEGGKTPVQVALMHGQSEVPRLLSEFRSGRA